ncbi:helix-turn-helix domain-containing protein [Herbiconiux sp. SYSU D00978]|uniref:helix-turn-helix domain-containing protein n=1 Tax=Herbiconiux sp. SYSU D00978 TaxID=2812562 RepID=UPI001A9585AA|nr:helix-turn-helix domain-containing protein [Herbiconiux sp. SYSU D00978]
MTEQSTTRGVRRVDSTGLKALAHPLRVAIVDALSTFGPHTASGLAERLGESSGATSYHLRQLEKHDFVREVEGRGNSRERWWERVPVALEVYTGAEDEVSEATRTAGQLISEQWERNRSRLLADFIERGHETIPRDWLDSSTIETVNLRITRDELEHLVEAYNRFLQDNVIPLLDRPAPEGSRAVQVHFNAFPVIDPIADRPEQPKAR